MATVFDVAEYILARQGEMTTWKLQKLVYYAQAWHVAWTERPLFSERIEAWANGPVVPELYRQHRGEFKCVRISGGDPTKLTTDEMSAVDTVVDFYGDKTGQWLSELTHAEPPWRNARQGLSLRERGTREIRLDSLLEYYGALAAEAAES